MSTATSTATYTQVHTVNFLTNEIWNQLRTIIRESGLDAATFVQDEALYTKGIRTWLTSGHLDYVYIEIYDKQTDKLIKRWDIKIKEDSSGNKTLWADTEGIRYAIAKTGRLPSGCSYSIKIQNKPGRPDVDGFVKCSERSTSHLTVGSVGTTATANGTNLQTNFYR